MTTSHDSNDSKFKTISKQKSRLIPTLTPKQRVLPQEIKGRRRVSPKTQLQAYSLKRIIS